MIAENLKSIRQRITRCCEKSGRDPDEVTLVCVTKEASIDEAAGILTLGVQDLGENRVRELVAKHKTIGSRASWHLIGHLQTNKVRDAVSIASLIHSVDSARLAAEINKQAARLNKYQDILLQVNTSGEESKFGVSPQNAVAFLKEISVYPNINIKGIMTIAPEADDPELSRPFFRNLKELSDSINAISNTQYTILSMGMTNDFEVAIEEGSTMIRVGRAIFGEKER